MAGAMGAIGGDISAANVNPAGVGVYITGDFQGTLGINSYKNTSTLNNSSLSYKKNNTNLNQLGGVMSFPLYGSSWKFVNIGVSYINQNLDDYTETPGNNKIAEDITWTNQQGQQINDRAMYDGHGYNRTGHLTKTNLTVGGNYNNKIYVGMGLNFHTADLDQETLTELDMLRIIKLRFTISSFLHIQNHPVVSLFLRVLLVRLPRNSV